MQPGHSLRTFTGNTAVLSLDFHPSKRGLICSCDNKEIRYWNIANGSCIGIFKGGVTQVRFQPGLGKVLAAAVNNQILMFDAETLSCRFKLQVSCEFCVCICICICLFVILFKFYLTSNDAIFFILVMIV